MYLTSIVNSQLPSFADIRFQLFFLKILKLEGGAKVHERAGWTEHISFYQIGVQPPLVTLVWDSAFFLFGPRFLGLSWLLVIVVTLVCMEG